MDIEGQKIEKVRPMTRDEFENNFLTTTTSYSPAPILVLENGTKIIPSSDYEGNTPGVLFTEEPDGSQFALEPDKKQAYDCPECGPVKNVSHAGNLTCLECGSVIPRGDSLAGSSS